MMNSVGLAIVVALLFLHPPGAALGESCSEHTTRTEEKSLQVEEKEAFSDVDRYFDEISESFEGLPEGRDLLNDSQKRWRDFVDADCKAVYEFFSDGSIRNVMLLNCRICHARERSYWLWAQYLEGTVTTLEEPKRCD